jgi:HD-GYP domain-containing protein (c-di-GMP phosphodiesterase class II)
MEKHLSSVIQIIDLYNDRVKEGTLSYPEAEKQIRNMLVGPIQADGSANTSKAQPTLTQGEQFLAFNSQGTLVIHPSFEGQNVFNLSNIQEKELAKKVLYEGAQVFSFTQIEPETSDSSQKIAVVRYYPQWDWYMTLVSDESSFYEQFSQVKSFLIMIVTVSYLITAILFFRTYRKDKAFVSSKLHSVQLAEVNQSILKTLAVALEERDAYTSGHSQRVAYYMRVIGMNMDFDAETLDILYTGGLLHDIGKIGIEDSILLKPGRLTEDEIQVIKSHPVRGEALLRKLYAQSANRDAAHISQILLITRHHHERFDGTGYPDRLNEEQIPILARVAAVADSFDAMTSSRAYRRGYSFSKACDEIIQNAGTQFCPRVVDAFFQSVTEETFLHAHHISRADELLQPIVDNANVVYTQQPIRG